MMPVLQYVPLTTGLLTIMLYWITPPAFSALRTLALSKMNYTLALATFIFALGPFVINLVRSCSAISYAKLRPIIRCSSVTYRIALLRRMFSPLDAAGAWN